MTLPFSRSWLMLITRQSALVAKMNVFKNKFWLILSRATSQNFFFKERISTVGLVVLTGLF